VDGGEISHRALEQEAVDWVVRRDSGEWGDDDQRQLDAWLATSTAHRVAFLRLQAGWDEARRLKALGTGHPRGSVPPPRAWRESPYFESSRAAPSDTPKEPGLPDRPARTRSSRPWRLAIAASLVLALGIGAYYSLHEGGERYSTPIGGVASVPLRDGSKITLNTRSQVRVDLSPTERRIDLDRGEAFFEVAKDARRPFVVRAGDKRIIAVGTQFSVSRNGNDVRVVVTEGTVRLETDGRPLRVQSSGADSSLAPASIPLTAGSVARARDEDLLVKNESLPQAEEILSWRQGYLIFHDTPLREAVDEFNRYNIHQMSVADRGAASMQISGMFRPTNYDAFVRLLQDGYALHVTASEDRTVLSKE
jgi:transmembrane sensor